MSEKLRKLTVLAAVVIILASVAGMLYPMVATMWNNQVHSQMVVEYEEQVRQKDNLELDAARAAAQEYNSKLFRGEIVGNDSEYTELLNLSGNGIMGYIDIPKINVRLPIYHGTSQEVLNHGAGHLENTSLPIGGVNTHSAISAHSGMAAAPMFSDLRLLEIGDYFFVYVLGEKLAYQVENITTVEPHDASNLRIQRERDIVTLITCTPLGVNTHRLLVQGCRVELPDQEGETLPQKALDMEDDSPKSAWMGMYFGGIIDGLKWTFLFIVPIVILLVVLRGKKKKSEESRKTE